MVELLVAAVGVLLLSGRLHIEAGSFLPATGMAWVPLYLLSCRVWPYRGCPWPWCSKRRPVRKDGRGNYRRKRACRVCGGGDWRRVGARLTGAGT